MQQIDVKEINLPFSHGEAPEILWGADFEELSDQFKVIYLKKFSSSMNYAAELIQNERNELLLLLDIMKQQVEGLQTASDTQKQSLVKIATDSNTAMQEAGKEIMGLKATLRKISEVSNGSNC